MNRRTLCFCTGLIVLLGGIMGILLLALRYEPSHYRNAIVSEEIRSREANSFISEFLKFWSAVGRNDSEWYGQFTDVQLNSFFQMGQSEKLKLIPDGVTEPRVVFEEGRMRLAFRYRSGVINTIVSITLSVWPTLTESNVLVLKLEGFNAGLVPCSAQWLLERISETARQHNIDVSWYRHEGHPVALIRFQADQARPTIEFKDVRFSHGTITIHGRSVESQASATTDFRDAIAGR